MQSALKHINKLRTHLVVTRSRTQHTSSPSMSPLDITSKYRLASGHSIPVLGYGVYQTPGDVASSVVQRALACGYRHVDSAVGYRNEAPSVDGMKASGISREELFFTTKISPKDLCYKNAKKQIDTTLQITGFEYVDLYLLHSPYGGKENRIGAWKALVEGVRDGKIRSIGVSNYGVHHLEELEAYIKETDAKEGKGMGGIISINQVELHPWLARPDIVKWCTDRGVLLEAYCPIVRGLRNEDPLAVPLAKKHGKTVPQVLIRWSLQMGFIPLPKSVTPSRIEENTDIYDFELTSEDMKVLDTGLYEPCAWDPTKSDD